MAGRLIASANQADGRTERTGPRSSLDSKRAAAPRRPPVDRNPETHTVERLEWFPDVGSAAPPKNHADAFRRVLDAVRKDEWREAFIRSLVGPNAIARP